MVDTNIRRIEIEYILYPEIMAYTDFDEEFDIHMDASY